MPRTARVVLPNYPHHIIQRGHNRQAVFASDEDYFYYLENLKEWKEILGCKIYAYWVKASIPDGEWEMIRKSIHRGQLTGSARFVEEVVKKIGRRVEFRGQGRPKERGK